jgi:hypothetical protein
VITLDGAGISADPATLAPLSLDSRLALLRQRRRRTFAKRLLAAMGPLLGMSLLVLAVVGGLASLR